MRREITSQPKKLSLFDASFLLILGLFVSFIISDHYFSTEEWIQPQALPKLFAGVGLNHAQLSVFFSKKNLATKLKRFETYVVGCCGFWDGKLSVPPPSGKTSQGWKFECLIAIFGVFSGKPFLNNNQKAKISRTVKPCLIITRLDLSLPNSVFWHFFWRPPTLINHHPFRLSLHLAQNLF